MKTKEQIEIDRLNNVFLKNWIKAAKISGLEWFSLTVPANKIKNISQIGYNIEAAHCNSLNENLAFNLLMVALIPQEQFRTWILNGLKSEKNKKIAIALMDSREKLVALNAVESFRL